MTDKGQEFMDMGSALEERTPDWMLAVRAEVEAELQGVGLEILRDFLRAKAEPKFENLGEMQPVGENAWTQAVSAEWVLTGEGSFNFNVANKFYLTGSFSEKVSFKEAVWTCSAFAKKEMDHVHKVMHPYKEQKKIVGMFADVVRWMLNN